jgi:hypothetical protein
MGNLLGDHEPDDLACSECVEHFGNCQCGGVVHSGFEETFVPKTDPKTGRRIVLKDGKEYIEQIGQRIKGGKYIPVHKTILTLECDRCDEYEIG